MGLCKHSIRDIFPSVCSLYRFIDTAFLRHRCQWLFDELSTLLFAAYEPIVIGNISDIDLFELTVQCYHTFFFSNNLSQALFQVTKYKGIAFEYRIHTRCQHAAPHNESSFSSNEWLDIYRISLFVLFNQALMFFIFLIIINSHQEKISLIFFKCRYISFFFDLIYRTISIFIPFQMNFSSGIFFYSRLLHNKAPLCNLL